MMYVHCLLMLCVAQTLLLSLFCLLMEAARMMKMTMMMMMMIVASITVSSVRLHCKKCLWW